MPAAATPAAVRGTLQPTSAISLDKFGNPHMHRPARGPPFGAGHEHAKHAMDPKPTNNKQIISDVREKLQARTQSPEARQLIKLGTPHMHMPARDLPFGAEHEQAKLAIDPLPAPPLPLTPAGEVIHPPPPALPPEAWPCECNTNKAKHPKRDKVFLKYNSLLRSMAPIC